MTIYEEIAYTLEEHDLYRFAFVVCQSMKAYNLIISYFRRTKRQDEMPDFVEDLYGHCLDNPYNPDPRPCLVMLVSAQKNNHPAFIRTYEYLTGILNYKNILANLKPDYQAALLTPDAISGPEPLVRVLIGAELEWYRRNYRNAIDSLNIRYAIEQEKPRLKQDG